jgi:hypothetical protein
MIPLLFEISDWVYYPYNLKRATSGILDIITHKGDFWSLLPGFLHDFWYVPLICLLALFLLIVVNKKICKATPLTAPAVYKNKFRIVQFAVMLVIAGITLIGMRGGLQYLPVSINNAVQDVEPDLVPVILNTPFSIITTVTNNELPELRYFPNSELKNYFNTTKHFNKRKFKPKNVVVIIIESYSREFTKLSGGKSYTPFLDSLMDHSLTCTQAYANALHSAEGIPAVLSGIPSLMDDPIQNSVYSTNHLTSLPLLLKQKGYSSSFYHGGTNGTMSFDVYCKAAGFDEYNGRTEYNNDDDYDGNWGIWDEQFLQFFATDINRLKPPFFSTVFTLSSHEPFHIPDKYQSTFPPDSLPIHRAVAYTDYSLRKFFETASKQPWYNNTLFVITADHCFPKITENQTACNMSSYAIPILYFSPSDSSLKGYCDTLTQQIDILPSVLDYLGYDKPFFALGNSIFSPVEHRYTANYLSGFYQFVFENRILFCVNMNPKGLFDFSTDKGCRIDLINKEPEKAKILLHYLRALMQIYNSSLIKDEMYIKQGN